jgi:hypothetical protein
LILDVKVFAPSIKAFEYHLIDYFLLGEAVLDLEIQKLYCFVEVIIFLIVGILF